MSVLREISLLKQLGKANHPNIVRLVLHHDIELNDVKFALVKVKTTLFYIIEMNMALNDRNWRNDHMYEQDKFIHPYLTRGMDPAYYLLPYDGYVLLAER